MHIFNEKGRKKWPLTEKVISFTLEAYEVAEVVVPKHLSAHCVQPRVYHLGHILAVLIFLQLNNACKYKWEWLAWGDTDLAHGSGAVAAPEIRLYLR